MDVKFEKDGFKFNVRSSCIIKDKLHKYVLLSEMRAIQDHEAYLLPGGRLELLENSQDAICREIKEEIGLDLKYKLISVEENFDEDNNFHMLEFVYYTEVENFDFLQDVDQSWDKFKIVEIQNIENTDVRPKTVKTLIQKDIYDEISHNINYDWGQTQKRKK